LNVERFGDEQAVGVAIGQPAAWAGKVRHVVVSLAEDSADDRPRIDAVAFHSDVSVHSDRNGLRDIARAIEALQAAREALLATASVARS
jgi:hypothetical protein